MSTLLLLLAVLTLGCHREIRVRLIGESELNNRVNVGRMSEVEEAKNFVLFIEFPDPEIKGMPPKNIEDEGLLSEEGTNVITDSWKDIIPAVSEAISSLMPSGLSASSSSSSFLPRCGRNSDDGHVWPQNDDVCREVKDDILSDQDSDDAGDDDDDDDGNDSDAGDISFLTFQEGSFFKRYEIFMTEHFLKSDEEKAPPRYNDNDNNNHNNNDDDDFDESNYTETSCSNCNETWRLSNSFLPGETKTWICNESGIQEPGNSSVTTHNNFNTKMHLLRRRGTTSRSKAIMQNSGVIGRPLKSVKPKLTQTMMSILSSSPAAAVASASSLSSSFLFITPLATMLSHLVLSISPNPSWKNIHWKAGHRQKRQANHGAPLNPLQSFYSGNPTEQQELYNNDHQPDADSNNDQLQQQSTTSFSNENGSYKYFNNNNGNVSENEMKDEPCLVTSQFWLRSILCGLLCVIGSSTNLLSFIIIANDRTTRPVASLMLRALAVVDTLFLISVLFAFSIPALIEYINYSEDALDQLSVPCLVTFHRQFNDTSLEGFKGFENFTSYHFLKDGENSRERITDLFDPISFQLYIESKSDSAVSDFLTLSWLHIRLYLYQSMFIAQTATFWTTVLNAGSRWLIVCLPHTGPRICTLQRAKISLIIVALFSVTYNLPRFFETFVVELAQNYSVEYLNDSANVSNCLIEMKVDFSHSALDLVRSVENQQLDCSVISKLDYLAKVRGRAATRTSNRFTQNCSLSSPAQSNSSMIFDLGVHLGNDSKCPFQELPSPAQYTYEKSNFGNSEGYKVWYFDVAYCLTSFILPCLLLVIFNIGLALNYSKRRRLTQARSRRSEMGNSKEADSDFQKNHVRDSFYHVRDSFYHVRDSFYQFIQSIRTFLTRPFSNRSVSQGELPNTVKFSPGVNPCSNSRHSELKSGLIIPNAQQSGRESTESLKIFNQISRNVESFESDVPKSRPTDSSLKSMFCPCRMPKCEDDAANDMLELPNNSIYSLSEDTDQGDKNPENSKFGSVESCSQKRFGKRSKLFERIQKKKKFNGSLSRMNRRSAEDESHNLKKFSEPRLVRQQPVEADDLVEPVEKHPAISHTDAVISADPAECEELCDVKSREDGGVPTKKDDPTSAEVYATSNQTKPPSAGESSAGKLSPSIQLTNLPESPLKRFSIPQRMSLQLPIRTNSSEKHPSLPTSSTSIAAATMRKRRRQQQEQNITFVLIIVVLIFLACNFPARVIQLVSTYE